MNSFNCWIILEYRFLLIIILVFPDSDRQTYMGVFESFRPVFVSGGTEVRQKNAFLYAKNAWHCSQPNQLTSGHRSLCHIQQKGPKVSFFLWIYISSHLASDNKPTYTLQVLRCILVVITFSDALFLVLVLWTLIAM